VDEHVLTDLERAVLELLKPFKFEINSVATTHIIITNTFRRQAVFVEDGLVTLYRWDGDKMWRENLRAYTTVELCDPGSFGVIEEWAGVE